ncbi:MAG TPA: hypothetical protein VJL58_00570 [Pyrinomonadaceae bacterium]|nr:hypothetical protein [Pyrinomonadaceae bacterium]
MTLRLSNAAAQKMLKKQKPGAFVTLRREQFEAVVERIKEFSAFGPVCRFCATAEGVHAENCPVYMITKLEKV